MRTETKRIAGYLLMPQVVPRINRLIGSGFGMVAFFAALVFSAVNLLPTAHPYLRAENQGRYGLRHVVFEVMRHLRWDWHNLDKIIIFIVVSFALALLFMQLVLLVFGLLSFTPAMALPAYFSTMFETANPDDDIAFVLLDRVFGMPGIYDSCVAKMAPCFNMAPYNTMGVVVDNAFPTPFHIALREMLSLYSQGLIVVGMIILGYMVITIIGETAQTGTPFGKRFNHVWAPLRLVVAFGLLIPMASGLNSAQYIALYVAKFGSGFATNGWNMFLAGAGIPSGGNTILGTPDSLIGVPNPPPVANHLQFTSAVAACVKLMRSPLFDYDPQVYIVDPTAITPAAARRDFMTTSFDDALLFANYGDIHVVVGEYKEESGQPVHAGFPAFIKPLCGEIVFRITDVADAHSPGSKRVFEEWYAMMQILFDDAFNDVGFGSESIGEIGTRAVEKYTTALGATLDDDAVLATSDQLDSILADFDAGVANAVDLGVADQITAPSWDDMDDFGWAGAAIWYNKIAELNGNLIGAVYSLPEIRRYPELMEQVKLEREKNDSAMTAAERFRPVRSDGTEINLKNETERKAAVAMNAAFEVWADKTSDMKPSGNIFTDILNAIFGTQGLFNMTKNVNVHPLAQLVAAGKSLLESSIRNLGASIFTGVAGGLAGIFGFHLAAGVLSFISGLVSKIAFGALTAGFLLFYIVPFMPFIYFFFAVGAWIKTIFEAMVGLPLWALAHLRIDGNGLPGSAAFNGYYLILEIFLRPICIIFGLLASVAIFGAQVRTLHEIWPMVVSNVTGFDANPKAPPKANELGGIDWFRNVIDEFLFTLMYAFIVYMMGMASFKLVDLVPDYIMRWMGASVASFGDLYNDQVESMTMRSVIGVGAGVKSIMGAAQSGGNALAQGAAAMKKDDGKGG